MGVTIFRVFLDGAIEPSHRLHRLCLGHAAEPVELQSPHDAVISHRLLVSVRTKWESFQP